MALSCYTCDYQCPAGMKGVPEACKHQWEKEVTELSEDLPISIRRCIQGLPLEKRKEVFTLLDWQRMRYWERDYGYKLEAVHGDESRVKTEKKKMEGCMRSIIQDVLDRYDEIVLGKTVEKKPPVSSSLNYAERRYAKDL